MKIEFIERQLKINPNNAELAVEYLLLLLRTNQLSEDRARYLAALAENNREVYKALKPIFIELHEEALEELRKKETDENLRKVAWWYQRIDPSLKIIATFYPQVNLPNGDFEDDTDHLLWGAEFDVTEEVLSRGMEALDIIDDSYTSDDLLPDEALDPLRESGDPWTVHVEDSLNNYFATIFKNDDD